VTNFDHALFRLAHLHGQALRKAQEQWIHNLPLQNFCRRRHVFSESPAPTTQMTINILVSGVQPIRDSHIVTLPLRWKSLTRDRSCKVADGMKHWKDCDCSCHRGGNVVHIVQSCDRTYDTFSTISKSKETTKPVGPPEPTNPVHET
jgi:hypothetical protein